MNFFILPVLIFSSSVFAYDSYLLDRSEVNIGTSGKTVELIRTSETPRKVTLSFDSTHTYSGCSSHSDVPVLTVERTWTSREVCDSYWRETDKIRGKEILDFSKLPALREGEEEKFYAFVFPNPDDLGLFGPISLEYTYKSVFAYEEHTGGTKFYRRGPTTVSLKGLVALAVDSKPSDEVSQYLTAQLIGDKVRLSKCDGPLHTTLSPDTEFKKCDVKQRDYYTLIELEKILREKLLTMTFYNSQSTSPLSAAELAAFRRTSPSKLQVFEASEKKAKLLAFIKQNGEDASIRVELRSLDELLEFEKLNKSAKQKVEQEILKLKDALKDPKLTRFSESSLLSSLMSKVLVDLF